MFGFKFHYCKKRMVAFINGELSERARRRVARYIDECPRCYKEYIQQREIQRGLKADMPLMGAPAAGQLDRIWNAIQADLTMPSRRRWQPYARVRYGMAMMLLIAALVLPLLFGDNTISQAAATQPTPHQTSVAVSILTTERPTLDEALATEPTLSIDMTGETEATIRPEAAPQRTPDASR